MKKDIYIIGAGAIGRALAVFLKLEKRNVFLLRGSVDDQPMDTVKLTVESNDRSPLAAEIEIGTFGRFPELDGIVVLTNKSYGNRRLAEKLKARSGASPIVILQNGLGVERPFIDEQFPEIYRCVLFATSQIVSENKISFKLVSASPIGCIKGGEPGLKRIVEQLDTPHFPFAAEADIQPVIWKKAIINSVFNSICPLLEIDNGVFRREQKALELAKIVIEECVSIAAGLGIVLEVEEIVEKLLLISRASDGQLISTLQDIKNKRETEIDTLNLEIYKLAKSLNMADAARQTGLLGELTRLKSQLNR